MKIRDLAPTRTIAAVALAAGIAMSAPWSAKADTDRTDCMGNNCVRVHCYDDTGTCTRTTNFQIGAQSSQYRDSARVSYVEEYPPDIKPQRYACDSDGDNCHWTRNYHFNDNGDPIDDSALYP
jgi:hypothetical protein